MMHLMIYLRRDLNRQQTFHSWAPFQQWVVYAMTVVIFYGIGCKQAQSRRDSMKEDKVGTKLLEQFVDGGTSAGSGPSLNITIRSNLGKLFRIRGALNLKKPD